jgi:hypothetical protein
VDWYIKAIMRNSHVTCVFHENHVFLHDCCTLWGMRLQTQASALSNSQNDFRKNEGTITITSPPIQSFTPKRIDNVVAALQPHAAYSVPGAHSWKERFETSFVSQRPYTYCSWGITIPTATPPHIPTSLLEPFKGHPCSGTA